MSDPRKDQGAQGITKYIDDKNPSVKDQGALEVTGKIDGKRAAAKNQGAQEVTERIKKKSAGMLWRERRDWLGSCNVAVEGYVLIGIWVHCMKQNEVMNQSSPMIMFSKPGIHHESEKKIGNMLPATVMVVIVLIPPSLAGSRR
ncbi:hypothetical protein K440DRAFT_179001 [Wilcoxina mikolae CBS 423.85]|nr:hypothetical protein K440DRAFT_179001 [Wilcoxina mikolae CBS 423.85]